VVQVGNKNDPEMSYRLSAVERGRPLGGKCQVNRKRPKDKSGQGTETITMD
jgi:hypothetical protein